MTIKQVQKSKRLTLKEGPELYLETSKSQRLKGGLLVFVPRQLQSNKKPRDAFPKSIVATMQLPSLATQLNNLVFSKNNILCIAKSTSDKKHSFLLE